MMLITLRAARVNCGYSQQEAAKLLGVHYQTLSKWENDSSDMPMSAISKASDVYHIPANNIFFGNENEFIRNFRVNYKQ